MIGTVAALPAERPRQPVVPGVAQVGHGHLERVGDAAATAGTIAQISRSPCAASTEAVITIVSEGISGRRTSVAAAKATTG